jgi:hypothetical protein
MSKKTVVEVDGRFVWVYDVARAILLAEVVAVAQARGPAQPTLDVEKLHDLRVRCWQYYDLGHGFCTYTFFEQCPHRMACARCDFYAPKESSKAQLLEGQGNLQRMLASIPLTDEEKAAVDDGRAALGQLLQRLADVPTPAGPTPPQIGIPVTATVLPIINLTADCPPSSRNWGLGCPPRG